MYMSGIASQPPLGPLMPAGIAPVQNYGKYPRLHHLLLTKTQLFCWQTKKSRKNIWRFRGKYVPLHSQTNKCFNSSVG